MIKNKKIEEYHEPVLVNEVLKGLAIEKAHSNNFQVVDATVGTAGHSVEIVKRKGFILGIDQDEKMLKFAEERLEKACPPSLSRKTGSCFKLIQGNFREIDTIVRDAGVTNPVGILFDLGVSNLQLTDTERGFSFTNQKALLDMRLDKEVQAVKGSDLLTALRKDQLKSLFSEVLTLAESEKLAKAVIKKREEKPIETVGDFLEICRIISSKPDLNYATLPFLALRIAVNSELENLKEALPKAFDLLTRQGRLVVISFHSGEDAIVKSFFKSKAKEAEILTIKPVMPSKEEVDKNPRARSAKLRVLEKK